VLAKRWTLQLLFLLLQRPARFSELERAVPGLTNRVMTDRLRELQDAGLVDRQVDPGPPITSIYALTGDGEALRPILGPLRPWADQRARTRGGRRAPGIHSLADRAAIRLPDEPHRRTGPERMVPASRISCDLAVTGTLGS
jgi:DNA-binding HxlR family transcriptional regulator